VLAVIRVAQARSCYVLGVLGIASILAVMPSGRTGFDLQSLLAILAATAPPAGVAAAVLISAKGIAAPKIWLWAGALVPIASVALFVGMLTPRSIALSLYGLTPVIAGWVLTVPVGLLGTIGLYGFIAKNFRY
jgi:hypothetical protein